MKLLYLSLVVFLFSFSANAQAINQYDADSLKHGVWVEIDTHNCDYPYIPQYAPDPSKPYDVIDTVFWFRCPSPCYSVIVSKENYNHGLLDGDAFQSRIEYCSDTSCDCDLHMSGIVITNTEYEKHTIYNSGNLISETYYLLDNHIKTIKYKYYYKDNDTAIYEYYNQDGKLEFNYFFMPSKLVSYKWGDASLELYNIDAQYFKIEHYDSLGDVINTIISLDTSIFVREIKNDTSYYFSLNYLASRLTYPDLYEDKSSDNNTNYTIWDDEYDNYPLFSEYEVRQITQKLAAIINVTTFIDINDIFISVKGLNYSEVQIVDSVLTYSYHFVEGYDSSDNYSEYGNDYSEEDEELSEYFDEYCGLKNQSLIKKGDSPINAKDFLVRSTKLYNNKTIVSRIYTYVNLDSLKWVQVDITKDTIYMPEGSFNNILYSEITTYNKRGKVNEVVKVNKEDGKYYRVTYNHRGKLISKEEIVIVSLPTLKLFEIDDNNYIELKRK